MAPKTCFSKVSVPDSEQIHFPSKLGCVSGCAATPCTFKLKRKSEFTVNITKPGCEPASVYVSHELSGKGAAGLVGNAVIGGVVGVGIDAVTGATQDLHPNPVQVRTSINRL